MQSAAYKGSKTAEVLDEVLIAAAFDQRVSLLLLDEAVFHLKKNQQCSTLFNKDIGALYRSLALYDIEHVFVEQDSLTSRGLSQADLLIPTTLLTKQELSSTLKTFDFVLSG